MKNENIYKYGKKIVIGEIPKTFYISIREFPKGVLKRKTSETKVNFTIVDHSRKWTKEKIKMELIKTLINYKQEGKGQ